MVSSRCFSFAAILLVASTVSARAIDEIQVYNAEIAKVGQWTFQLHSNYAFIGRKEPDFPGGLIRCTTPPRPNAGDTWLTVASSSPMAIKVYFMISLLPNKKVSRGNPSKFDQRQLRRLQFVMADLRLWSPE
jgi:hypothetical protein